jgi:hypothetical protein
MNIDILLYNYVPLCNYVLLVKRIFIKILFCTVMYSVIEKLIIHIKHIHINLKLKKDKF